MTEPKRRAHHELRERLHEVIFEADTPAGKTFDIVLLFAILISVIIVMLDTVPAIHEEHWRLLLGIEWVFTILFTIEYLLRLYCVYRPWKYATSFFGVVDLLAVIPTYLSLILAGSQFLIVIRALRLIRIFRVFKIVSYMRQGRGIAVAIRRSIPKLVIFIMFVLLLVIVFGSVMYLVEGQFNPEFDSIPRAIYWAIVTITTVGYGDISPMTVTGQFLAALMMLVGYAFIAVPTGIVSVELYRARKNTQVCRYCGHDGHDDDATYCKLCGERINEPD